MESLADVIQFSEKASVLALLSMEIQQMLFITYYWAGKILDIQYGSYQTKVPNMACWMP